MQTNKSNGQLTAQINVSDNKKSGFDLSNNVLGTGKIGRIIPTRALHVMPGDTIKQDSKVAVQFEPLAVPILANMEVKQEHFYVPYNVVWKDWDKFITGGEKMDYQGVVPNISFRSIIDAVNSTLGELQVPILYNDSHTGKFDYSYAFYLGESAMEFDFSNIKNMLDTFADTYQLRDLLQPQYETLKLLKEINTEEYMEYPLFYSFHGQNDKDLAFDEFMSIVYERNPERYDSKYIQELLPSIKEKIRATGIGAVPTNLGVKLLLNYYEFYKPIIGIGSNIDYLNMGRVTFTDFLYNFCEEVLKKDIKIQSDNLDVSNPINIYLVSTNFSTRGLSILNLRANYSVWYNNYRDILLEEKAFEPTDSQVIMSAEIVNLLIPRQRCWEKDAFTTALDNPGTGNVGVAVGSNQVSYHSYIETYRDSNGTLELDVNDNGDNVYQISIGSDAYRIPTSYLTGFGNKQFTPDTTNTGFSLYQLEAAQRAQKWLQKALFFGNRISDFYYLHFGVRFLDARLRLPELLSSSSQLVKLDVLVNNTTVVTDQSSTVAGDRAAYASAFDNGNSFDRFCEEHGVILSYLTIMPQITYAYGCNRDYSRLDQFDYAFSEFATLGMDAVFDTEITSSCIYGKDPRVFGYQGKYYDYKAKHSEEHGELLDSQDMYTFSRKFDMYSEDGRPKLNYEFVHCFPDLDMFVVDNKFDDYFRFDVRHSTAAERDLPSQSIYI